MTKPGVVNNRSMITGLIQEIALQEFPTNYDVSNIDLKADLFFEVKKLQPQNIQ